MKKGVVLGIIGSLLVLSLVGCDSKESGGRETTTVNENNQVNDKNEEKNPDVQVVADTLLKEGEFADKLAPVDINLALTRLYALDQSVVESCAFYTNSNATAEEIAVIKVKDSADVDTIKAAYETRVEEQKAACKDYLPDEMPKLEDAIIYSSGNYVVLCVSVDNNKIEDSLTNLFE